MIRSFLKNRSSTLSFLMYGGVVGGRMSVRDEGQFVSRIVCPRFPGEQVFANSVF